MVYITAGDKKIIIGHTNVDESLKGQGIGKQMLSDLVAGGIKVIPLARLRTRLLRR
jgi:predicted GNAT family acetyltransferase